MSGRTKFLHCVCARFHRFPRSIVNMHDAIVFTLHGFPRLSIYEGYTLHHAIFRCLGRDLTEYLMKNLTEQGVSLSLPSQRGRLLVRSKRNCAASARITTQTSNYGGNRQGEDPRAPRENIISIGADYFHCVDTLFQPSFIGKEASGSTTLLDEVWR